jgi:diguanylate cyclase (GGDEF)-like protein/PAS domain S-box-containing protein
MQEVAVNLFLVGLVVFLFGAVYRARGDDRLRLWVAAWIIVMVHIAGHLWSPAGTHWKNVQECLSLGTLALAGICFVVSNLVVRETSRAAMRMAAWLTSSTMLCLVLLIFGHPRSWILSCLLVLQHAGTMIGSYKGLRSRPAALRALTATRTLGLVWMLAALWTGRPDMVIPAMLAELFACAAFEFWFVLDHGRGVGTAATCIGLFAWSAVFPIALLADHFWIGRSFSPEFWILPKFCTAFGMILIVLEADTRAACALTEEYRLLFEANPHPLWIFDVHTLEILSVNQAALDKHGYTREEFLELKLPDLVDPSLVHETIQEATTGTIESHHGSRHRRKNGTTIAMDITAYDIVFQGRQCRFMLANDVTDRELLHQQLVQQARRDVLTGLPNRLRFEEQLTEAVAHAVEVQEKLAILCLKIDRLKRVNDTYGPHVGDACLVHIAKLLSSLSRGTDVIARTGGNEFAVVLTGLKNFVAAENVANRLMESLSLPLIVGDCKVSLSLSIGIAVCPGDGTTVFRLWRGAEGALHHAQEAGGARTIWLSPELASASDEQIELEAYLHIQLEEGGFHLAYQPIYGFDGEVHSLEALLRLNHPKYGAVSPAKFIPIAEQTGLIIPIGDWVIGEACRQLVEWKNQGMPLVPVALNVSALQFMQSGFAARLINTLRSYSIDPHLIQLEVTESTTMFSSKEITAQMENLSTHGIHFSIDDFGTGHSSLRRLDQVPLSVLKIDRSFTERLCHPQGTLSIVRAIIALAKTLDIKVVAEGVESEQQLASLRELQCEYLQGFLLSRPVKPEMIPSLVGAIHPMVFAAPACPSVQPASV